MEDDREKLANQIRKAPGWWGYLRFDLRKLRGVRVKGDEIIFYLESGPLMLPISELNKREAAVAYDYYESNDQLLRDHNIIFLERITVNAFSRSYFIEYKWRNIIFIMIILLIILIGILIKNS